MSRLRWKIQTLTYSAAEASVAMNVRSQRTRRQRRTLAFGFPNVITGFQFGFQSLAIFLNTAKKLQRLHNKEKADEERRWLLTLRTKQYLDAFNGLLHKLPYEPVEVFGYFEGLEDLLDTKPKLLQAHLNEKAKSVIARLTRDPPSDYDRFKGVWLNEYRVTPVQLREIVFSLAKKWDEIFVMLTSKLHDAFMYCIRSRNINNNIDALVSLVWRTCFPAVAFMLFCRRRMCRIGVGLITEALPRRPTPTWHHTFQKGSLSSPTKRPRRLSDLLTGIPIKRQTWWNHSCGKSEASDSKNGATGIGAGHTKCFLCGASALS